MGKIVIGFMVGGPALLAAIGSKKFSDLQAPGERPLLDIKAYWGPKLKEPYRENQSILPFDISVKPEIIGDLRAQLSRPLRAQEPLEDVGFQYGFNAKELGKMVKYWRDIYLTKWSEREEYLKKFDHFQTEIQGLKIHFIHAKPNLDKNQNPKKVLPLLLMHGWPGTVREFYDFIPLLTTPSDKSDYVFEVIAPSLPGYGWSQGSSKTGFGVVQMAVVMRNLMVRLGFEKFLVQGGDAGSAIGSNLAALFPENVLGYHSNMCMNSSPLGSLKLVLSSFFPSWFVDTEYADFYKGLGHFFGVILEEMGYFHIQASKPDTIGNALIDNPVGLASYILEKFSTWTNTEFKIRPDGGLTQRYTYDQLLDNVMIYYVTNSITTSMRLYAEYASKDQFSTKVDSIPILAKAGCTRFRHEINHFPDSVLANKFPNLVHSTHHAEGGHFPAFEVPQKLYDDFITFFKKANF
ncbi:juvenile hormone epoxide hydrolase 1-like [Drosophila bipectinata]|uniref:juvenile hormone epoxide hydrolase 1-like n=1 Tax=Drosophila bipectinata TaxID=42026 RepID=UPI001C896597|nr:juvenile hormone epoxide hydrolase 1-like [Drosophila bipectinata]